MKTLVICAFLGISALADTNWTRFRGPNGTGVAAEANSLPAEFNQSKNVVWKAAVPFSRSSPIVYSKHVYLTTVENDSLITLALDISSGKELWRRAIKRTHKHQVSIYNDPASPTPTADDAGVYSFFGDFGLVAYTHSGKERWRLPLGPFNNYYGLASSPVVIDGTIYLQCDQTKDSFLIAVDRRNGKVKWKADRNEPDGWGVPVVYRDTLLAPGTRQLLRYALKTGEVVWSAPVSSLGSQGTPLIAGDLAIVNGFGFDKPIFPPFSEAAARLDADQDATLTMAECAKEIWFSSFGWIDINSDKVLTREEWEYTRNLGVGLGGTLAIPLNAGPTVEPDQFKWRFKRNLALVPSPLIYDGIFYMIKDAGIVTALNPETGAVIKQGRSKEAMGQYLSSPVAADGKIFMATVDGKVTVLKTGQEWDVLRVNDLQDEIYATPAISGNVLLIRTRSAIFAFGDQNAAPASSQ